MINYLTLFTALLLSAVAAYYSIIGLTAIFATAFIPIVVMGCTLELAKVMATSWLYRNWNNTTFLIKSYLSTSIVILMLITSMGTFGYLSKAHTDQVIPISDSVTKLELVDERIRTLRLNVDISRKALKQLDEAVDQMVSRSDNVKGVNSAIYIRKTQQNERSKLLSSIENDQKKIAELNEERLPLLTQVKKIEAEVGPIKFIAALFTDNNSQQALEAAVRWVIILIVIVFDPLAIALLIAANQGILTDIPKTKKPYPLKQNKNTIRINKKSILEMR